MGGLLASRRSCPCRTFVALLIPLIVGSLRRNPVTNTTVSNPPAMIASALATRNRSQGPLIRGTPSTTARGAVGGRPVDTSSRRIRRPSLRVSEWTTLSTSGRSRGRNSSGTCANLALLDEWAGAGEVVRGPAACGPLGRLNAARSELWQLVEATHGRGAVAEAQLGEHRRDVRADGDGRDAEQFGDLGCRPPVAQEAKDLPLAIRQPRLRVELEGTTTVVATLTHPELVDHARHEGPRQRRLAVEDALERPHEPVRVGVLEQVARRTRLQRREQERVVADDRQHDDRRRRHPPGDLRRGRDSAAAHPDVEQANVRSQGRCFLYGGARIVGLGAHVEPAPLQGQPHAATHGRMVVGDHNRPSHGTTAPTTVPRPGADVTSKVPPSSSIRSRMLARPKPAPSASARSTSNPRPLSRITSRSRSARVTSIATSVADPCRAAFAIASRTTRASASVVQTSGSAAGSTVTVVRTPVRAAASSATVSSNSANDLSVCDR